MRPKINDPQEIRDYFNTRGRYQPASADTGKHVLNFGPFNPGSDTIPENHIGTWRSRNVTTSVQDIPAGIRLGAPVRPTLVAGRAYTSAGWSAEVISWDRDTGVATLRFTYIPVAGAGVLDYETTRAVRLGVRLEVPATGDVEAIQTLLEFTVNVGNIFEPPRLVGSGTETFNVNVANDNPVERDLSQRFAAEDGEDWELYVFSDLANPALGTVSVSGKTVTVAKKPANLTGTTSFELRARNTGSHSAVSSAGVRCTANFTRGLNDVDWSWTITNVDVPANLPDWEQNDGGIDKILLNPGTDGSSSAVGLGTWRAVPTSDGTVGTQSYELTMFSLTGGSGVSASDVSYDETTGDLTYTGGAIKPGTIFQVLLYSRVQSTSDTAFSENFRTIQIRTGWKPRITFRDWNRLRDLPEIKPGSDTKSSVEVDLANIIYTVAGLPPGTPSWILHNSWSVEADGKPFHMTEVSDLAGGADGGLLTYYGRGELRSVQTRLNVKGVLTISASRGEHNIESASEETPNLEVKIVPPAPVFVEDSYTFSLEDGTNPRTTGETIDNALGQIEAVADRDYSINAYSVAENSPDTQRQFGANATSGYIYYTGPLAASLRAAADYDIKGGATQMASDGDISPVGEVPVHVDVVRRHDDVVKKNPHYNPGLTYSMVVGDTLSIDTTNGWLVPSDATESFHGTVAPVSPAAFISSDNVDNGRWLITANAIGVSTFTVGDTVTFADGTTAEGDTYVFRIEVHSTHIDTPFKFLQRSGAAGSYTYSEITSVSASVSEGSAAAELFTGEQIYFWCPNIGSRVIGISVADDDRVACTLDDEGATIPVPGEGSQSVLRLRLTVDGTKFDYEALHRYTPRLDLHSDPYVDGNTTYSAFTEFLPVQLSISNVNELPVRRTGNAFNDITARVGATASPILLEDKYSDPEGRRLNFRYTSSAPAIVSGSIVDDGQSFLPQFNAVGTATITIEASDGTTPTRWTTPTAADRFTVTVEAAALHTPTFAWQNPVNNVSIFSMEDLAVGSKLYRNLWASATTSESGVVAGDITYDIGISPPDFLPDVSILGASWIWWKDDRWYLGGNLGRYNERARTRQGMASYDRFGQEIDLGGDVAGTILRPGYARQASNPPAAVRNSSSYFRFWSDTIDDPRSSNSWDIICAGSGTANPARGGSGGTRGNFVQRFRGVDTGIVGNPNAYISSTGAFASISSFIYAIVADGSDVWVSYNGSRILRCYRLTSTTANEITANGLTIDSAICDQPQAMRLNNARDTLYVVCRLGTTYSVRAWNWPARTRNPAKDKLSTTITGRAQGAEIIDDWMYVVHWINGESVIGGSDVAYVYLGEE